MRKLKLLPLAVALMASFCMQANESQTYSPSLTPVKQVVKKNGIPKMLSPQTSHKLQVNEVDASQFQGLTIYANLTNSDDWNDYSIGSVPYGIYSYTVGSDTSFQPIATSFFYNFMASAMGRDQLVGVRPMELLGALNGAEYIGLSASNFSQLWSQVYNEPGNYSLIPSVMAYNPTDDKFYSVQYNYDLTGLNLAVWDRDSKSFNTICPWTDQFQPMAMAFTPNGILYCIGSDAVLYTISLDDSCAKMVATLEVVPSLYVQGMGYEPRSACFVWMAVTQQGSAIYAVNPSDASTTLIAPLNKDEQSPTVFFLDNQAPAQAPAASADLKFNLDGGSTTGTLDFTVPTTTFAGHSLSGNVEMQVWIDGIQQVSQASVAPGSKQSIEVDLTNDNHYAYVLYKNDGGFSPACYVYSFAGYDTPLPVTNLNLTVNNGISNLTWTAPTGGVNGGYIDNITYDVVRMPGEVMVAQGISQCEFSETLPPKMERYYYVVTPYNGPDKKGESATSNSVLTGTAFVPPYYDDFSDTSTQDLWTVINANNDASNWGTVYTWQFNSSNSNWSIYTSSYNMGEDADSADDYLISPGISLEEGISYALIAKIANTFSNYKERVSLLIGTNPNDISTFTVLDSNEEFDSQGALIDWEHDLTVDEAGTYYFAVRVYTHRDDNGSGVTVSSMAVNVLGKDNAPAEVTNLLVTPDDLGEMIAHLSFTAPTKQLNGEDLTGNLVANIYRDNNESAITSIPVVAGQDAQWTDNNVTGVQVHTYSVAVENEAGEGKRVSASAFIGVYTPPYSNTFDTMDDALFYVTVNDSSVYSTNEYRWIWDSYGQRLSLGGYGYFVQHPVERIWLHMPAIKLEKDNVYTYAFNWSYSSYDQSCPAYAAIGMAPDSTAQAIYPEQLPFTDYGVKTPVENEIITTETGKYYPSVLVVANKLYNYISPSLDDVSITLVGSAFAPYAIENLSLENDNSGALKAYFKFNAPSVDYAQRPLEGKLDVYIYRSGSTIPLKTFANVDPGQELEWTDEQPLNGNNSYIIVGENSHGRGKATTAQLFVGLDVPMAVENLKIRGNADNQKAVLTWDAVPSVGVNGGVVDNSLIYNIVECFPNETDPNSQAIKIGNTTETTYTVDREPTNEMEQHFYAVIPQTSAGMGAAVIDNVVLGKLKEADFNESFAGGNVTYSGWQLADDGATYGTTWYLLNDSEEMSSQDGDNGLAMCYNGNYSSSNHWATLISPKIKINPGENYILSFYVYTGMAESQATTPPTLVVSQSNDDYDFETLTQIDVTTGTPQWTLVEIPLLDSRNSINASTLPNFMKFSFAGYMNNMSERIWLDNIVVRSEEASGIENLEQKQNSVIATSNGFTVNCKPGEQVNIYSVDGRLIDSFKASGCNTRTIAPGVYIVTVASKSYKIRVK